MTPSVSPLIVRLDLPADCNGEELVLGWRRVNADFTSRAGSAGRSRSVDRTRLEADRSDDTCSRGCYTSPRTGPEHQPEVVSTVLIVAYRPSDVAHVSAGRCGSIRHSC